MSDGNRERNGKCPRCGAQMTSGTGACQCAKPNEGVDSTTASLIGGVVGLLLGGPLGALLGSGAGYLLANKAPEPAAAPAPPTPPSAPARQPQAAPPASPASRAPAAPAVPLIELRCKIAGVSYGNRQEAVARLQVGEVVTLRRERNNEHDANAVEVYDRRGEKLGYIPRDHAGQVAGWLDSGRSIEARVLRVAGSRPGYRWGALLGLSKPAGNTPLVVRAGAQGYWYEPAGNNLRRPVEHRAERASTAGLHAAWADDPGPDPDWAEPPGFAVERAEDPGPELDWGHGFDDADWDQAEALDAWEGAADWAFDDHDYDAGYDY